MITDCSHGMPDPKSCFECMEDGPVAPPTKPTVPTLVATFNATYPGDCPGCLVPIRVGDRIGSWTDGRYRHAVWCEP